MPTKIKKRWTDAEVPREVEDAYHQVLDKLIQLDLDHDEDGECRPYMLDLAEDAKKLWVAFYNSWAAEQANAEGELAAAYSKLEGYAARLALIHHVVSHVFLDASDLRLVGTKSIEAGIYLARWFGYEVGRIYATLSETVEQREHRWLVEWIR